MKNGAQSGPATTDELRASISSGGITANTLVWREGLAGWVAANTLNEFAGLTPPPPSSAATGTPAADPADVEKNKVFAVLSYLPPLLFIVALIAARPSKFAMYHCNQGLVLTLAAIAAGLANMVLDMVLMLIPVLGWLLMMALHLGLFVGVIALVITGVINAANGVCKPLPVIGNRFTLVK
jgi:uncharacterized membrane protein